MPLKNAKEMLEALKAEPGKVFKVLLNVRGGKVVAEAFWHPFKEEGSEGAPYFCVYCRYRMGGKTKKTYLHENGLSQRHHPKNSAVMLLGEAPEVLYTVKFDFEEKFSYIIDNLEEAKKVKGYGGDGKIYKITLEELVEVQGDDDDWD